MFFSRSITAAGVRSLSTTAAVADVQKVGVLGMGLMGHGIAQTAAAAGYEVTAVEMSQDFLDRGMGLIKGSLEKVAAGAVKKGKMTQEEAEAHSSDVYGRIESSTDLGAFKDCDLIIEAIVEDYEVKNPIWADLGSLCKEETIFASNTSSLSITQMGDASGRPDRMCGLHYFNPVQVMKLVEIVRTDHTSDSTYDAAKGFVQKIGKVGISCKDTPGFVVNRLLVPFIAQAQLLVERGDASPEDVDIAMRLGAGHPMGPIHLSDYVGQDINFNVLDGWVKNFDDPAFVVPASLEKMVQEGNLGRKTGKGFYEWDSPGDTMPKHLKKK